MKSDNIKILLILISIIVGTFSDNNVVKNYCDSNLCGNLRNTACNNTGRFSSSCPPGIQMFTFTEAQKRLIVDEFNSYRSSIALGSSINAAGDNFPMASQMNKLQWDKEQEFMSSLHVKTCASHDPCKNTWYNTSFFNITMFAGQNIYYESTYAPLRPPLTSTITNAVAAWYNEIIAAPVSVVDKVETVPGYEIGHFLALSHDQTVRVGCTGSQYEKAPDRIGINKFTQITCNFDKTPFLTLPLYKKGNTCTECAVCDWESDSAGVCIVDPKTFANTYYF